jgi:hypothetical protein
MRPPFPALVSLSCALQSHHVSLLRNVMNQVYA